MLVSCGTSVVVGHVVKTARAVVYVCPSAWGRAGERRGEGLGRGESLLLSFFFLNMLEMSNVPMSECVSLDRRAPSRSCKRRCARVSGTWSPMETLLSGSPCSSTSAPRGVARAEP